MISPFNITSGSAVATSLPVCGRRPAWASRESRGRDEPLPAWVTREGFIAPGPHCLQWSGRRWDNCEEEYDEREDVPAGSGSCFRLILAQNAHHDGRKIVFDDCSYFEFAHRPYYFSEEPVYQYLLSVGYSEDELKSPMEDWVRSEIIYSHLPGCAIAAGGYLYSRPFVWPAGDTDLCRHHFESLYEMPYPEPYGDGFVHEKDVWPSPKNIEGFYALRHLPGEKTLSSFDCKAILRRAWQGSKDPRYGNRYGTKDDLMRDLPPGCAFDIRIRKMVLLTKREYHETEKESQAIYEVSAWRITGSPPEGLW